MSLRALSTNLKNSLLNYDPFIVVHLIKFEKPQNVAQYGGVNKGVATDFTYLTDGQYDISYNDGTTDVDGNALGTQNYRANKITKLGTVNENVQAKASNLTLSLDSSSLGASATVSATFTSTDIVTNVDLVAEGFREGDKILLSGSGNTNAGAYVRIDSFKNSGKTIGYTTITSITNNASAQTYTITLSAEELNTLLTDKASSSYSSYINREVLIYKAHINPETRQIIGDPFLYFKGIISGGSINEKLDSSEVVWSLTSHWGDFLKVQGRLTDDSSHRALRSDGSPDLDAVIRPAYASDLGFIHANTAINHIATYQVMETRYKMKKRGGIAGALGGKKTVEYEVEVDRDVNLQFNPQAKMLPVVYGVRKIESFPIFVDTHKNDSAEVYKVDALCEGPVAGILDIHIEDNTTICLDKPDFDTRSTGGSNYSADSVEVVCSGRQDRGDTLSSYASNTGALTFGTTPQTGVNYIFAPILGGRFRLPIFEQSQTGTASGSGDDATGITHKGTHTFKDPIDASLTFYAGKPNQEADHTLLSVAESNNFKIQNSYFEGDRSLYWSTSHRLLDTAYISSKYTISEGETTIPDLKYVVRGRDPECYNYDSSYRHDDTYTSDAAYTAFALGASVTLHKTSDDSQIGSAVTIIDKWSTFDVEGNRDHRFRFSTAPSLGTTTAFYMKSGSNKWHMQTWDHEEHSSSPASSLYNSSLTVSSGTTKGLKIVVGTPSAAFEEAAGNANAIVGLYKASSDILIASEYSGFSYNSSTNTFDNVAGFSTDPGITRVYIKNAIHLGSSASISDDYYNGNTITVTDSSGGAPYIQKRKVIDYDGGTKVALVDDSWDYGHIPTTSYTYSIGSIGDRRVTINPAMQLLDYMTNERYGKGLNIDTEMNLDTWKSTARACDTRSDITVLVPSSASISADQEWEYPNTGTLQWRGTVKSVETIGSYKQVTFTNNIGKFGKKWNSYDNLDLYWYDGKAYDGGGSAVTSTPTGSGALSTVTIGNAANTDTININISLASANGNPLIKKYSSASASFTDSGYSLYDADDVKYWRYVGWDDNSQRNVTRHQMNQVIETTAPIFDNINNMLSQFNGILRYSTGKYELDIKRVKETLTSASQISDEDIIGTIKLTDKGIKNSKNSVSTAIIDPANKFEGRSISFFNSTYLKEDKGIQKKGNYSLPGITNYFNARFGIKQFLDESRYGLTIQFKMAPRGLLLLAGNIIELTYPRFGYTAKPFRITNLNFLKDGTVDVVADEHNDDAYIVDLVGTKGFGEVVDVGQAPEALPIPARPTGLLATLNNQGEVVLTWKNTDAFSSATHLVEIYRSRTNSFEQSITAGQQTAEREYRILTLGNTSQAQWNTLAGTTGVTYSVGDRFIADATSTENAGNGTVTETLLVGTSDVNVFHDIISKGQGLTTRYYWIRYMVRMPRLNLAGSEFRNVPSLYYPNTDDSGFTNGEGITGVGLAVNAVRTIKLDPGTTSSFVYQNDETGIESGYTTTTTITSTKTNDAGTVTYVWKLNDAVIGGATSASYTYTPPDAFGDMPQKVSVHMTDTVGSETFTATDSIMFTGTKIVVNGASGVNGFTVTASNGTHNFSASSIGAISSVSGYSSTFTVLKGTTTLTYDASASPAANTYKLGSFANVSPANSVVPINTNGTVTISSSSGNLLSGTSVTQATFDVPIIENDSGATIATFKMSITKSLDGGNGLDGVKTALVYAYQRSSSALTSNPGAVTVNLNNGTISTATLANSWEKEIPSGTDPIYVVAASAAGTGSTDTIADSEWSAPVVLAQNGITPDALTVSTSYDSSTGETTLTFSDGSTATVSDGGDGTSKGVKPLYAATANPTAYSQVSTTQGSNTHVNFYEFTGTYSDLSDAEITALTFVKIVGEDGDSEGVTPVYAADASGTSASFTQGSLGFVNFYEWTDSAPASVPSGLTYVKFVGVDGDDGLNSATVFIYKKTNSASESTKPAGNTTYTFDGGGVSFTTDNGWSATIPSGTQTYLWARTATASSTSATDTIADSEWSGAELLAVGGGDGVRGGGIFTFEESTNTNISATTASKFAGTLDNTAAIAVAAAVIAKASDSTIRPNDRITVTDNSANKAGTRVYTASAPQTASGSVAAGDFSALVVETFDGSVIVDGTLSAGKLAADTTLTNNLTVGSNMVLNNTGKFYTTNKTAYTDNDAGFFLGYDSSEHKLNLGNASNYVKWDGSALTVAGTIAMTSSSTIGTTSASDIETKANNANQDSTATILGGTHTGSVSGNVTGSVGGTAASTVASGAADGTQQAAQASLLPKGDDSEWALGEVTGTVGIWTRNGSGGDENTIVLEAGPHGDTTHIWKSISTDGSGADGGFQNTGTGNRFDIESDVVYRFTCFVKQSQADGTMYFGGYNYNSSGSTINLEDYNGTGGSTNKYFWSGDLPTFNEWYLFVGFINPAGTSINSQKGGLYKVANGERTVANSDFRFNSSATQFAVRTYLYYSSTSSGTIARWAHPRIDRLDRAYPSIEQILVEESNIRIAGGAASGNSRAYMDSNGLLVVDGSGNKRVKIGNLSNL